LDKLVKIHRASFESVTGITLNASDSFPKKICVSCKNKLESASEFKKMCTNSRKEQELMLQGRIKRGRNPGESPSSKRNPLKDSAESEESRSNVDIMSTRYRAILPKTVTNEEPTKDGKEGHILAKYGCDNPKVS